MRIILVFRRFSHETQTDAINYCDLLSLSNQLRNRLEKNASDTQHDGRTVRLILTVSALFSVYRGPKILQSLLSLVDFKHKLFHRGLIRNYDHPMAM